MALILYRKQPAKKKHEYCTHIYIQEKETLEEKIRTEGNIAILAHELKKVITQLKELQEEVKRKLYTLLEFAIIVI